jgi:ADP-ribose pyrophosphatase YjhB (NUDIX family)
MSAQTHHKSQSKSGGEFQYCPYCGTKLANKPDSDGHIRKACPHCFWTHYRNPTVGIAAIIQTSEGLLLGRRRSGGWCIPCGHVEWNESIRQAAVREMKEELGVDIELGSVYNAHSNFHDPSQHTVGIWFEATLPESAALVPGGDIVEVRAFPLDQIPDLVFPTDRLIVEQLRR